MSFLYNFFATIIISIKIVLALIAMVLFWIFMFAVIGLAMGFWAVLWVFGAKIVIKDDDEQVKGYLRWFKFHRNSDYRTY